MGGGPATTSVDPEPRRHRPRRARPALRDARCDSSDNADANARANYRIDADARDYLQPLADVIDDQNPALERYALVLHLLRKAAFDRGGQPWQDAALVMRLRNEVVHYKSKWGAEMTQAKLWRSLQALRHLKPPFTEDATNFFPQRCLSAACAAWAAATSVAFIDAFYDRLSIASPLEGHRHRLQL